MIKSVIRKNAYYDSVTLMLISRELSKMPGVEEVLAGMATELNLELVENLKMVTPELDGLGPNDFFISAKFDETQTSIEALEKKFFELLNDKKSQHRRAAHSGGLALPLCRNQRSTAL